MPPQHTPHASFRGQTLCFSSFPFFFFLFGVFTVSIQNFPQPPWHFLKGGGWRRAQKPGGDGEGNLFQLSSSIHLSLSAKNCCSAPRHKTPRFHLPSRWARANGRTDTHQPLPREYSPPFPDCTPGSGTGLKRERQRGRERRVEEKLEKLVQRRLRSSPPEVVPGAAALGLLLSCQVASSKRARLPPPTPQLLPRGAASPPATPASSRPSGKKALGTLSPYLTGGGSAALHYISLRFRVSPPPSPIIFTRFFPLEGRVGGTQNDPRRLPGRKTHHTIKFKTLPVCSLLSPPPLQQIKDPIKLGVFFTVLLGKRSGGGDKPLL